MKFIDKYYRSGKTPAFLFYVKGVLSWLVPGWYYRWRGRKMLQSWRKREDADYLRRRRDLYCRASVGDDSTGIVAACSVSPKNYHSRYAVDAMMTLRYFPKKSGLRFHGADCLENPLLPTLTKARRLYSENEDNAVILNIDSIRHWLWPKDNIPFRDKKPVLFFRGEIDGKPARIKFFEQWADSDGFDLGDTTRINKSRWHADFVTIPDHFHYQFILALEGNDMASALQWIMASNCVPVMPRPTVEGWLMHSRLIPGKHYIEIASDFSDVGEKIRYYIGHPEEAEKISVESKKWMQQFRDKNRERLVSLLVVDKYLSQPMLKS